MAAASCKGAPSNCASGWMKRESCPAGCKSRPIRCKCRPTGSESCPTDRKSRLTSCKGRSIQCKSRPMRCDNGPMDCNWSRMSCEQGEMSCNWSKMVCEGCPTPCDDAVGRQSQRAGQLRKGECSNALCGRQGRRPRHARRVRWCGWQVPTLLGSKVPDGPMATSAAERPGGNRKGLTRKGRRRSL
jgi:hypothetical protein